MPKLDFLILLLISRDSEQESAVRHSSSNSLLASFSRRSYNQLSIMHASTHLLLSSLTRLYDLGDLRPQAKPLQRSMRLCCQAGLLHNKRTGTINEFWIKTLLDVLWLFLTSENYFNWLTWCLVLLRTGRQESRQSIEIISTCQK